MKKRTIIDQIEITRNGDVHVRFALLVLDDDGTELMCRWHRSVIPSTLPPGDAVAAQLAAVNADITARPGLLSPPVDADMVPLLRAVVAAVAAHRADAAVARR